MYAGLRHIFRNLMILYVPKWQSQEMFDSHTLYDYAPRHCWTVTDPLLYYKTDDQGRLGVYVNHNSNSVIVQRNKSRTSNDMYYTNNDYAGNGLSVMIDRDFVDKKSTIEGWLMYSNATDMALDWYNSGAYRARIQRNTFALPEPPHSGWTSLTYDCNGLVCLDASHHLAITSNIRTAYNPVRIRLIRQNLNVSLYRSIIVCKCYLPEEQTLELEHFIDSQENSKLYNDMPLFVSTYIPEIINENISYNSEIVEVAPKDKGKMCSYAVKNQTLVYGGESLSTEQLPTRISLRTFNEYFTGTKISTTFDSTLHEIVKQQFQYVLSKFRLSQNPSVLFPTLDFLICPRMQGIIDSDLDTKSNVHYTNARSCLNGYDVIKNLIEDSPYEFTWFNNNINTWRYLHAPKRLLHLDDYQNITYDIEGCTIEDAIWNTYPYSGFGCLNHAPGWSYCVGVIIYRTSYLYDPDGGYYLSGYEQSQNMQAWAYTQQHGIFGMRYPQGLNFNRNKNYIGSQSQQIQHVAAYEGWWVISFNIDGSPDGSKFGRTKVFTAQVSAPALDGVNYPKLGILNNQWISPPISEAWQEWSQNVHIVFRMIRPQSGALKMMAIHNRTLSDDEFSEFNHYLIDYALTCTEVNGNQQFRGKTMYVCDPQGLEFI